MSKSTDISLPKPSLPKVTYANEVYLQKQLSKPGWEIDTFLLVRLLIQNLEHRKRVATTGAWKTTIEFTLMALQKLKVFL
jgi:hypothetical protein